MSKKAYFVGIKGVGMTSLALAMQDAGWQVEGSDTDETFITEVILAARSLGVRPLGSPTPEDVDLLIYSTAYSRPESNVRTLSLAEALAEFVRDRKVIAVAGVGGKTTTSAMLATLFHAAGRDVGYYVGTSTIAGLSAPGHAGEDPYFVIEADEYAISKDDKRPKFALLRPEVLVTTNIVHDHPDIYPDVAATKAVFVSLIKGISATGTWVCNPADRLTSEILQAKDYSCQVVRYGAKHPLYSGLNLSVFGDQNRMDALAAVLAAEAAGVPASVALFSIRAYRGAGRRQESHGEVAGRLLYDDYGHHPQEIEVTVKSFKEHFPGKRILLVFESHTYSRTEALLEDFARAIATADIPFIMPIFESAREKNERHTITPESFAECVKKYNSGARAVTWENAAETVAAGSQKGDIIVTMGAGFVYMLHEKLKKLLG